MTTPLLLIKMSRILTMLSASFASGRGEVFFRYPDEITQTMLC